MYTTNRTFPRKLLAIAMTLAMVLTMTVSAFASNLQPNNADATSVTAAVNAGVKTYSVTITAPDGATKIMFDATLYQKQLFGRKMIDTMSASVNSNICYKSKSVAIESEKTYMIEVTAQVYSGGTWDTIEKTITVKT